MYLLLVSSGSTLGSGEACALALGAARATTTVGRGERKVNVLLAVETDDERGDVDDLLANADVALLDQDTGVVDRLGKTELEDLGLEAALEEILGLEVEHVIELFFCFVFYLNRNEINVTNKISLPCSCSRRAHRCG